MTTRKERRHFGKNRQLVQFILLTADGVHELAGEIKKTLNRHGSGMACTHQKTRCRLSGRWHHLMRFEEIVTASPQWPV
jgi:hypothetical protein